MYGIITLIDQDLVIYMIFSFEHCKKRMDLI